MKSSPLLFYRKCIGRILAGFIMGCLLLSCGGEPKKSGVDSAGKEVQTKAKEKAAKTDRLNNDSITLYEDRIGDIPLPFPRQEMSDRLKHSFKPWTIVKEMGQQDGPDFPLYSLKGADGEIAYFSMDSEDTLKLAEVHISAPMLKDVYGLKVGDGYQKIKRLREGEIKTYTNYHQHTFAYFDDSNILYEISGEALLSDSVDLEEVKFTEAQLKGWTIEYIIWRE